MKGIRVRHCIPLAANACVRYSGQCGLTLVEIMVALVISLFLLAGMVQIFASTKTSYRVQEGSARLQENARFAMEVLGKDIRMAGYQGCINLESIEPNVIVDKDKDGSADLDFSMTTFSQGYDANATGWSPTLPVELTGSLPSGAQVKAGTDVIMFESASPTTVKLSGNLGSDNANIQIDSNPVGFQAGDILFITDCETADVFAATSVSSGTKVTIAHASNLNTTPKLSQAYPADAQVMQFERWFFYVRDNDNGEPALFRMDVDGQEQEIVEGVEDFQLLYGIDIDGNRTADRYLTANAVTDWSGLVSVRVALLLRTVEEVATGPEPFRFMGNTINPGDAGHPGDRRLRREFSATISMRNRSL